MITEGATFAINNNADGNLTTGWTTLKKPYGGVQWLSHCHAPLDFKLPSAAAVAQESPRAPRDASAPPSATSRLTGTTTF